MIDLTRLPAAAETFPGGVGVRWVRGFSSGTIAPPTSHTSAVQISKDVVVDLTGDLFLF